MELGLRQKCVETIQSTDTNLTDNAWTQNNQISIQDLKLSLYK